MALTRKFLAAMGIDADKVDEIIAAHAETVDALKGERDAAKADAAKLAEVTAENTRLSGELEKAKNNGTDAAKVQADFDAYKAAVATEKANASKALALDALLKDAGIHRDSFRKAVAKDFDLTALELDDKGGIKTAEAIKEKLKGDTYKDFISTVETGGTQGYNPPSGWNPDYDKMSDAEYYAAIAKKKG